MLTPVLQGQIQIVQRGQQIAEHVFGRVTHLFLMFPGKTLFEIFHFRGGAQAQFLNLGLEARLGVSLGLVRRGARVFRHKGFVAQGVIPSVVIRAHALLLRTAFTGLVLKFLTGLGRPHI